MLGNNLWFEVQSDMSDRGVVVGKHITSASCLLMGCACDPQVALRRYKPLSLPLGPPLVETPFGFLEGFKVTVIRRPEEADLLSLDLAGTVA